MEKEKKTKSAEKIAILQKENKKLLDELAAMIAEKEELLARINELKEALIAKPAPNPDEINIDLAAEIVEAVNASCLDHCPHHLNPDACRTCRIGKLLNYAKLKTPAQAKR